MNEPCTVTLPPEQLEELADLIADRLTERTAHEAEMLTVAEAARELGVGPDFVRDHREELRAVPYGDGPRPRLRIPASAIEAYKQRGGRTADISPPTERAPARQRRRPARSTARLLPVHGERP